MKETAIIIKYPSSSRLVLFIGGFICLVVGIGIISLSWSFAYIQIIPLIFGSIFLLFGVICCNEGFKTLIFDAKGIALRSPLLSKYMDKDDVKGYAEVRLSNSKEKLTKLVIFSRKQQTIGINSQGWGASYDAILKELRKSYDRVGPEEKRAINRRSKALYKNIGKGAGGIMIMVAIFQLIFQVLLPNPTTVSLPGTVYTTPNVEANRKGRVGSYSLQLKEYPGFFFTVVGSKMKLLAPEAKQLEEGDEILCQIAKKDLYQKFEGTATPTAIDRNINWNRITLYGLQQGEQVLLSNAHIKAASNNPIPKIFLLLLGVGVYAYYRFVSKGYD